MPGLVSSTLTWERVITTDVGADLGFFNNSLNLTFDWFQRDTKDMLAPSQTLPSRFLVLLLLQATTVRSVLVVGKSVSAGTTASVMPTFMPTSIYMTARPLLQNIANDAGLINNFYTGKTYGEIWGFETDRYFEESDFSGKDEKVTGHR